MFRSREVKVFRFCSTAATKSLLVWIIFFAMDTRKVNKFGRSYRPGVALDQDFKRSIIDRIISDGGDRITGYIPRSFTQLADELRVSANTVKSVWYRYCEEMQTLTSRKEAQHLQNYRKRTLNSSKYWKSTPRLCPFPKSSSLHSHGKPENFHITWTKHAGMPPKALSISLHNRKRFIVQKWHITDKTVNIWNVKLRAKIVMLQGWTQTVVMMKQIFH